MLLHEWQKTFQQAADDHKMSAQRSELEIADIAAVWFPVASRIYISHKMDSVCTGLSRHYSLAVWMLANAPICYRYRRMINWRTLKKIQALEQTIKRAELDLTMARCEIVADNRVWS